MDMNVEEVARKDAAQRVLVHAAYYLSDAILFETDESTESQRMAIALRQVAETLQDRALKIDPSLGPRLEGGRE